MSSRLIISRSGRAAKVPLCRGSVTILAERIVVRAAGSRDRGYGGRGPWLGGQLVHDTGGVDQQTRADIAEMLLGAYSSREPRSRS